VRSLGSPNERNYLHQAKRHIKDWGVKVPAVPNCLPGSDAEPHALVMAVPFHQCQSQIQSLCAGIIGSKGVEPICNGLVTNTKPLYWHNRTHWNRTNLQQFIRLPLTTSQPRPKQISAKLKILHPFAIIIP
jgi:hypothetical protein